MRVKISNDKITISDIDSSTLETLKSQFSYEDKQKKYQIQKMRSNPFTRNSPYLRKLEKEVWNTLVREEGDDVTLPSGFAFMFDGYEDLRHDTGEEISLPWEARPFDLRDYQEEAVGVMQTNYRGIIELGTGLGKTLTTVHAIRRIKKRSLVVCPNISIANNFYKELVSAFGERKVGYVGNGKCKIKDITVGIAQSVLNRIEDFKNQDLGLVVFDETHHIAADTFFSLVLGLNKVGKIFGLTATAFRSDGKDILITAGVGNSLVSKSIVWGIKNNWLAKPVFIIRDVMTTGRDYPNDKLKNYKEHVLSSKQMNELIKKDISTFLAAGKSVLCLVNEVSHGELLSNAIGLKFANGKDKKSDTYVTELNEGKIPGLVGTGSYIGEGTDTKNVDVLILANFVANKGTLWQNLGRGLRIHNGNNQLIVIDYIPSGSEMLKRHALKRVKYYKEITDKVKIV